MIVILEPRLDRRWGTRLLLVVLPNAIRLDVDVVKEYWLPCPTYDSKICNVYRFTFNLLNILFSLCTFDGRFDSNLELCTYHETAYLLFARSAIRSVLLFVCIVLDNMLHKEHGWFHINICIAHIVTDDDVYDAQPYAKAWMRRAILLEYTLIS
jgi:hypothetical protein